MQQIIRRDEGSSRHTYGSSSKISAIHGLFPLTKMLLSESIDHPRIKDTIFPWRITRREESWLVDMYRNNRGTPWGEKYLKSLSFIRIGVSRKLYSRSL